MVLNTYFLLFEYVKLFFQLLLFLNLFADVSIRQSSSLVFGVTAVGKTFP